MHSSLVPHNHLIKEVEIHRLAGLFKLDNKNRKRIEVSELQRVYDLVMTMEELEASNDVQSDKKPLSSASGNTEEGLDVLKVRLEMAESERDMIREERDRERKQLESEIESLRNSLEKAQEQGPLQEAQGPGEEGALRSTEAKLARQHQPQHNRLKPAVLTNS